MDLETQSAIERLVDEHGADELLVILGAPDPEAAGISAETVVVGDPSYSGPLAEAQLGLDVYHVLENDIREEIPDDVFEEQVALMGDVLDVDGIAEEVASYRAKAEA